MCNTFDRVQCFMFGSFTLLLVGSGLVISCASELPVQSHTTNDVVSISQVPPPILLAVRNEARLLLANTKQQTLGKDHALSLEDYEEDLRLTEYQGERLFTFVYTCKQKLRGFGFPKSFFIVADNERIVTVSLGR